ncbi:MAG: integrase core domain-containing protein, partial [Candidatus Daviesbacteria bacterium]|nr:integrase core domain-containing protein [Candidatus Daviesbacteria bacterium]
MRKAIQYQKTLRANSVHATDKWTLLRSLGKDNLSLSAQLKLEWIIFYHTVGNKKVQATASHFGISRKTLHKWLSRFNETHLKSLEDESRKPKRLRTWMVNQTEEVRIIKLRKDNMELGKIKLKRLYFREYQENISTWKIERVIRQFKLFPDKATYQKRYLRKKDSEPKLRIHKLKDQIKQMNEFGLLWHVDAVIIHWNGVRKIIFTALEDITKIAFARVYSSSTSNQSEDFLKRLHYLADGKISIIHQDNGSEFQGKFKDTCRKLNIRQIYSRPYTPKDNPALERFNRTIQEEWLNFSEVGLDDIQEANEELTLWLVKYNSIRPHQSLDYLTPLEYAQANFFQVLPMYPAST